MEPPWERSSSLGECLPPTPKDVSAPPKPNVVEAPPINELVIPVLFIFVFGSFVQPPKHELMPV